MIEEELLKQELLSMPIHKEKAVDCASHDLTVRRVFGGWIYTAMAWNPEMDIMTSSSMCFVPETIE